MIKFLKQPYPRTGPWKNVLLALVVGLFVGIFLVVFQPFGLSEWQLPYKRLFIFGYGLVTFVVFVLLDCLWPRLLPGFYSEERWTVGKQVLQILLIVSMIGLGNLIYSRQLPGGLSMTFGNVLYFQWITLAIAVFPVTILTLLNELRLARRNSDEARRLQASLQKAIPGADQGPVLLKGENKDDSLKITAARLLYLESADNYSMVHYTEGDRVARMLLRGSLTSMASQLEGTPLVRCHRGFIVNLEKVKGVSGNAQGYRLRLEGTDQQIPVSRKNGREIITRLR